MRFKSGLVLAASILGASALPVIAQSTGVAPTHGVAMHGDPKYGPDFKHFDYVNPSAPKVVLSARVWIAARLTRLIHIL